MRIPIGVSNFKELIQRQFDISNRGSQGSFF